MRKVTILYSIETVGHQEGAPTKMASYEVTVYNAIPSTILYDSSLVSKQHVLGNKRYRKCRCTLEAWRVGIVGVVTLPVLLFLSLFSGGLQWQGRPLTSL